jgi:hypothetical protein
VAEWLRAPVLKAVGHHLCQCPRVLLCPVFSRFWAGPTLCSPDAYQPVPGNPVAISVAIVAWPYACISLRGARAFPVSQHVVQALGDARMLGWACPSWPICAQFFARGAQLHNSGRLQHHTIDIADAGLGRITMLRIVAATSLVLVSWVVLADDKGDCQDSKDHDLRIKACSAMILSNPKDVVAYHNRGDAYGHKGDIDRAISDYTKAIVLDPNYVPAYNSRGRAYVSKGDYVRAVDDVTRAGELTYKPVPKPQPSSAVVKAAAHKSKEGQTAKSGLTTPKPGLLPPAGMVAHQKSKVAKPGPVAPKQEALPTAGKAAPHKSNDQPQAGVAVSGKAAVVEPAWAQSELKNSHGGF